MIRRRGRCGPMASRCGASGRRSAGRCRHRVPWSLAELLGVARSCLRTVSWRHVVRTSLVRRRWLRRGRRRRWLSSWRRVAVARHVRVAACVAASLGARRRQCGGRRVGFS